MKLPLVTLLSLTASSSLANAWWVEVSPCPCADGCANMNVTRPDTATNNCIELPFDTYSWTQDGPSTTCVLYTGPGCTGAGAGLYGCNPSSGCCFDAVRIPGAATPWVSAACLSNTS
ncbi:hypothetical protein F4677DRAFT_443679 [Hypoxylon crocopeplum]|nr:hypothetical protein F4677DRAFT_443679 [Hypoxylon crocopeplum]